MAGLGKEELAAITNRAKRLINMDKDGTLNEIAKGSRGKIESMISNGGSNEIPIATEGVEPITRSGDSLSVEMPLNNVTTTFANSKLPKEILESFKNKTIGNESKSVLDDILPVKNTAKSSNQTRPTTINEVRENNNVSQTVSNIDYSLIKTIVEDCMRKYAASITKKILNESKSLQENSESQVKLMRIGERFTMLDDEGNLYEATLKFKKKIK